MRRFRQELDRLSFFDLSDSHGPPPKPCSRSSFSFRVASLGFDSPARRWIPRSRHASAPAGDPPGPGPPGGAPALLIGGAGPHLSHRGSTLAPPPPSAAPAFAPHNLQPAPPGHPHAYPVPDPSPAVLLATSSDLPPSVRRPSAPSLGLAPPPPPPPPPAPARSVAAAAEEEGAPRPTSSIRELDQVGEAFAKMKHAIQIMGGISDALLVVRPDGSVAHMNESAREMFRPGPGRLSASGHAPEGAPAPGEPGYASVLEYFAPEHEASMAAFLAAAAAGRCGLSVLESEALPREGSVRTGGAARRFPVEISVGRMQYGGDFLLVLVVRDISERKELCLPWSLSRAERRRPLSLSLTRRAPPSLPSLPPSLPPPASPRLSPSLPRSSPQAMERALKASEERARVTSEDMRRILETAGAPIFMARMLGRELLELVAPDDRPAAAALFARALHGREEAAGAAPAELCLRVPQAGNDLRLLLSATPRRDARGAVVGAVAVGQDMTEKRRRIEAEATNETKNRFLAYTVHELRTPLNGVLGLGELLGETSLDEEQRELSHAIHNCSEQVHLPFSLTHPAHPAPPHARPRPPRPAPRPPPPPRPAPRPPRPRAGLRPPARPAQMLVIVDLEAVPFDLRPALEELVEIVAPTAFAKGVELASFIPPPLEGERCPRLVGDPCRLKRAPPRPAPPRPNLPPDAPACRQIITNLAYNGIKFTHKGHVIVACEVFPAGPAAARLRVEVSDTGLGIDPKGIDRIWQDYVQADQSITRLFGGTGMGLPISKRLVELMGGSITVESVPGHGSTFTIEVPLALAPCAENGLANGVARSESGDEAAPEPAPARLEDAPSLAGMYPHLGPGSPALYPPRLALPPGLPAFPPLLVFHPDPEVSAIVLGYARSAGWPGPSSRAHAPPAPAGPEEPPAGREPPAALPPHALVIVDESSSASALDASRSPDAERGSPAPSGVPAGPEWVAELPLGKPVRYHKFVATLQRALDALAAAAAAAAEPERLETAAGAGAPEAEAAVIEVRADAARSQTPAPSPPPPPRSSPRPRSPSGAADGGQRSGSTARGGAEAPRSIPGGRPGGRSFPRPSGARSAERRRQLGRPSGALAIPKAAARASPHPPPPPPPPADGPLEQPPILVVDDVDLNRKVCVSLLKKGGLACDQATHGGEAVDHVRARCVCARSPFSKIGREEMEAARGEAPYRVIFMDMEMPVLDGTGATREIRRLEAAGETGGPPSAIVVECELTLRAPQALTANAMEASLRRCLEAGMNAVLVKPVRKDDVLGTVERHSTWRRP
eukprot:tig00000361_g24368.t1